MSDDVRNPETEVKRCHFCGVEYSDEPHYCDGEIDSQRQHTIEITAQQRARLDRIKTECKAADPGLPAPTDEQLLDSLLDTWDAVDDGLYSNPNSGRESILSRLKSALSLTALKGGKVR